MNATIGLDEQYGLVLRTTFDNLHLCKAIPGGRWRKQIKAWCYPASPSTAKTLHLAFAGAGAVWSDGAAALLVEADKIEKAAEKKTADNLAPIPLVKTQPWLHQLRAYHFAYNLPAVMLALDMGTGKSKVVVDLVVNKNWSRVLILCPKSVVQVWPAEFERHAARTVNCLPLDDGMMTKRAVALSSFLDLQRVRMHPAVVIVNYDAAWRDSMAHAILSHTWDAVVCDESHRIKAPGGKAALFCSRLGDAVPHRLCLTGTPMPHSPLDVYGQYRFLDKGIFGTSFTNFRAKYAVMGGYQNHQVKDYQNQEDLQKRFYSIAYRVQSEDVQNLPEAVDVVRPVVLGAKARGLYDVLKKEFTVGVGTGTITASNALTRLLRLQQIGSGWARTDRNIETGAEGELIQVDTAKQDVLADLMEDLKDDEPLVVFCRFHHDLDAVHAVGKELGRGVLELSGRENRLADWQSGQAPILAVQIQSGGVGINLVRARYCVFYSLGFSLGEYLQARKRIHRPGQQHTCTYYHLIAKNTVDEQVYAALEAREDVVESILKQARG
jgi:SNF2 family DNA or RNA helicase